ncbi:hypothetical protein ABDK56_00175 [Sphingomonas sp. ASV193]|uniref:hypothetical protein n=1 Tax=Sphingomonas sp. ASV193 TaxID=3144405 RepID=UPI0032E8BDB7
MKHLKSIHTHSLDFWYARLAVVVIAALQLAIVNRQFVVGPRGLFPALEGLLLVPLAFATAWAQQQVRDAETDAHWETIARHRRWIRRAAIALTALISIGNFFALIALVSVLLGGHAKIEGVSLLLDAMNIWLTNVIAFSLWYWSIDRGGPPSSHLCIFDKDDFLFPQMQIDQLRDCWSPGFVDYLYLSFTNATAFSPTDTLPLTARAKLLMMTESAVSLLTLALVAARAVNILA